MPEITLDHAYLLRPAQPNSSWRDRLSTALGDRAQVYDQTTATAAVTDWRQALLQVVDEWARATAVTDVELCRPTMVRTQLEPFTEVDVLDALGPLAEAFPDGLADGTRVPWRVGHQLLQRMLFDTRLDVTLYAEGRCLLSLSTDRILKLGTSSSCDHLIAAAESRGLAVERVRAAEGPELADPDDQDVADADFWDFALGALEGDEEDEGTTGSAQTDPTNAPAYPLAVRRVENAEQWHLVRSAEDLSRVRAGLQARDLVGMFDDPLVDPESEDGADLIRSVTEWVSESSGVRVVLVDQGGELRTFLIEHGDDPAPCLAALASASLAQVYSMALDEPIGSFGLIAVVPDDDGTVRSRWA
jgi:hypothetical protein